MTPTPAVVEPSKWTLITGILTVISVFASVFFLYMQNEKLKAALDASQLKEEKDKDEKIITGESDSALKSELDSELSGGSPKS